MPVPRAPVLLRALLLRTLALPVLAAALVLAAAPAQAAYRVCNKGSRTVSLALAWYEDATEDGIDNGRWISRGWWNVAAGACETLIRSDLRSRYLYLHAESAGRSWPGDTQFCLREDSFLVDAKGACARQGAHPGPFVQIDTGANARTFTTTLTDRR